MIKSYEKFNIHSCFNKAEDDEPIFVLRSKDKLAPLVIEFWMVLARYNNSSKVDGVLTLVEDMKRYANKHFEGGQIPN